MSEIEKPSKKDLRAIMIADCKKIHEYLKENPLLQRLEAIKILIEKGEIRKLNPVSFASRYKEIYGKTERNTQLKHEKEVLIQYMNQNGLEKKPKILMEAIKTLQEMGKIRQHISANGIYRFYLYSIGNNSNAGNAKTQKKVEVEVPEEIPENMTRNRAKMLVSDFEKYNFEGRIMALEVKKAYEIVNKYK